MRTPALLLALLALAALPVRAAEPPLPGINLAGAEFGSRILPGRPGHDYVYPADAQLDWARDRGFRLLRLPVLWERLQPAAGGPLDPAELARVRAVVAGARARGLRLLLDVHNYGSWRGNLLGTDAAPAAHFTALWRRLAEAFRAEPDVLFGLMNEPQVKPATAWAAMQQDAIDAIRAAGARNLVVAGGAHWDGAHSWIHRFDGLPSNAEALASLRDPADALLFEVHQYLDADFSGTHADCPRSAEAASLLRPVTEWLRANNRRGLLGEFGGGPGADCLEGLRALVDHMRANPDAWAGWTAWAAGAWWRPDYPLLLSPGPDGRERPQLRALFPDAPASAPTAVPPHSP